MMRQQIGNFYVGNCHYGKLNTKYNIDSYAFGGVILLLYVYKY